jgi:uncharacterized protein (DUF697 family)
MATTSRKTVKSNPLDNIETTAKSKSASRPSKKTVTPASEPVEMAQSISAEVLTEAVISPTAENTLPQQSEKPAVTIAAEAATVSDSPAVTASVIPAATASLSPAATASVSPAATASVSPAATASDSPKQMSAEELLSKEFTPNSSIVMIPSSLLEEDPLVDVHALHTVKTWSQWSVLGGLIPTPIVDTVAITGIQIKMIHDLCKLYNVEFKKEAALAVVSGLVGGTITTSLAGMGASFLSYLPVVGSMMKYTVQPALCYATTYALGRVFMRHFEGKGTMADIDSKKLASYFKEQYARGRKMFKYEFKVQRTQNA